MKQILGKQIRLISKKEEDKDVLESILSVVVPTKELFVSKKPSTKPNLLVWEIQPSKTTPGAIKFFNLQTVLYLTSNLPNYDVHVTSETGEESDWLLFSKSEGSLIQFSDSFIALEDVWIRSVKTQGFLSVRSNEGWTAPGKVWTRGTEIEPAGAFSWERFRIQLFGTPTKREIVKENETLRQQLTAAHLEIQNLKAERQQLEEYKQFFQQFKKLSEMK